MDGDRKGGCVLKQDRLPRARARLRRARRASLAVLCVAALCGLGCGLLCPVPVG